MDVVHLSKQKYFESLDISKKQKTNHLVTIKLQHSIFLKGREILAMRGKKVLPVQYVECLN